VNIESLIELSSVIRDRGELDAEFVRDDRFRFAQGNLNADFHLGRCGAAFPQHASGMGNGVFVEFLRQDFGSLAASAGSVPAGTSQFASRVRTP
jgi:hypothetical protein